MELGDKIKETRLAAGLSQRELCADRLTRNMLSQIENGSARPSMKTLEYLAGRLQKPISYFLGEQPAFSPNQACMEKARHALEIGDLEGLRQALDAFYEPDSMFSEEKKLLEFLWHLHRGEEALRADAQHYGVVLLQRAEKTEGLYITDELRHRCRMLLAKAGEQVRLNCDEILLLRAQQAVSPERQLEILAAVDDQSTIRWNYLQGEALFCLHRYEEAIAYFQKAPQTPEIFARLEVCCREIGDYKNAYAYACKQRR